MLARGVQGVTGISGIFPLAGAVPRGSLIHATSRLLICVCGRDSASRGGCSNRGYARVIRILQKTKKTKSAFGSGKRILNRF
jgi:hypothetical protein